MDIFTRYILPFFLLAVAFVLVRGLWTMVKGNNPNLSQTLMRMRVVLQFIAIVAIMGFLYFSGYGPR